MRFLRCGICGNLVGVIEDSGAAISCCGAAMGELAANSTDAAKEKHVPVVSREGDEVSVTVGSAAHPMTAEHSIRWVYLLCEGGGQRKALSATGAPEAAFALAGDAPIAAYAYCNLHGLWMAKA